MIDYSATGAPETADVFAFLEDGYIAVTESGEERGTTDACWTASNQRNSTPIRHRYTTIANLWNMQSLKHLINNIIKIN